LPVYADSLRPRRIYLKGPSRLLPRVISLTGAHPDIIQSVVVVQHEKKKFSPRQAHFSYYRNVLTNRNTLSAELLPSYTREHKSSISCR